MAQNWTPEQLETITQRDCNLLVAAAAGAGKTAVLVERIIRKITDSDRPVDIDRLLVVTFTNAAATEMRERIGNALAEALEANPSSANLQRQMALLDRASIMTLHSFCMEVVRNHFHSLDLDPLFRICDETESELMKLDVLEELFEEEYDNEDSNSEFFRLVDSYGGGRDDSALREMVLTLHRFTRSHPWPEQWLAAQAEAYNIGASACLSSTPWARVLLKGAAARLQGLLALLDAAATRASQAQGLEPYLSVFEADRKQLDMLLQLCKAADEAADAASSSDYSASTGIAEACDAEASSTASDVPCLCIDPTTTASAAVTTSTSDGSTDAPGNNVLTIEPTEVSPSGSATATLGSGTNTTAKESVAALEVNVADACAIGIIGDSAYEAQTTTPTVTATDSSSTDTPALPINADAFWDALHYALASVEYVRLPRCKKDADKEAQDEVKAVRSQMKAELKKLYESGFDARAAEIRADLRKLYPLIKYLSRMVCRFDSIFAQKKKGKGLLDFNDLEHYCLRVLIEEAKPAAAAKELSERYEEILVDEYQDSNLIQEFILETVSGKSEGRHNIFMVGDVKQSIYRFRQARPELFMSKYLSYPHDSGYDNRVIQLYKNFRSRPEVIHGVNYIFRQIMSETVGELDYTKGEYLNPGLEYEEPQGSCTTGGSIEVHILDVTSKSDEIIPGSDMLADDINTSPEEGNEDSEKSMAGSEDEADTEEGEQEEETLDTIQAEARIVGKRIKDLISGNSDDKEGHKGSSFSVFDKKEKRYRPAEYKDIVILMRATRNWADVFSDELAAMGIPAYSDAGLGYFRTVEVETMLSLLQIIDNPLQDIPMLSVLRSPIGRFNEDELADIRLADRKVSIYEAARITAGYAQCSSNNGELAAPGSETANANNKAVVPDFEASEHIHRSETANLEASKPESELSLAKGDSHVQSYQLKLQNDEPNGGFLEYDRDCALRRKTAKFLERLDRWRDASQYTPTDELVWQLLSETGYYSYVGILPGGPERQANLRMLFERARQYEETSYKGLFNFISFINRLRSGGGDMGSAKILGENDNVVRIMSIHKSKGLEFPIVIVAGCGKKFNMLDLNAGILLHQELGFGPELVDLDNRTIIPTMPKFAIRQKLRMETLSEEMRIMYVAFTRAREKLIITGSVRNMNRACSKWCAVAEAKDEKLPSYSMMQSANYLDWICPSIARHEAGEPIRLAATGHGKQKLIADASIWQVRLWGIGAARVEYEAEALERSLMEWLKCEEASSESSQANLEATQSISASSRPASDGSKINSAAVQPASDGLETISATSRSVQDTSRPVTGSVKPVPDSSALIEMLQWQYPYRKLSSIPAKISVTELKRRFSSEADQESAGSFVAPLVERPSFMQEDSRLSAAQRGTIMHFVMQHINLERLAAVGVFGSEDSEADAKARDYNIANSTGVTNASAKANSSSGTNTPELLDEIESQLALMSANEQLTAAEAEAVSPKAIAAFFGTAVGRRMLGAKHVHREMTFNIEINCEDVYSELNDELYSGETMLLQGVIDCWFETEEGIVLLDYKTDYVPQGGEDIIRKRYMIQIEYYTRALEKIIGRRVSERYIYLFHTGSLLRM